MLSRPSPQFKRERASTEMAKILPVIALVVSATILCLGQQASLSESDMAGLLAKLRSSDIAVRAQAFEKLKSDPTAVRGAKVKAALLALLDREKEVHPQPTSDQDSREGEYIEELSDTVSDIADWDDPSEVCALVRKDLLPAGRTDQGTHLKLSLPNDAVDGRDKTRKI